MNSVDYLANTGIVSVSWNRSSGANDAKLPEKTVSPLGSVQPSYIDRIFKTQGSDAHIVDTLAFKVSDERILTPANYQDILEQLRGVAANTEVDENQRELFTQAACLLDEFADNVRILNLNRQLQTSS